MKRRLLIVDDHAVFRQSARRMLEADGYEVVGEAADGASGIAAAHALKPEVVLLDVQLPDIDGFDVASRLTGEDAHPVVVLTSSRDGADFGPLVERSGALGFVPKHELCGAAVAALLP
jgi:DNA-binding NarL/FixJ family response regulator